jgi:cation diffusion facilitator family transporter
VPITKLNVMSVKSAYFFVKLEGWLSLFINLILFVLKYWAGIVSGSVALIADAWHTLSDSLTSVIVLVGAKISEKPPDEEHPFGHGRAEAVASIIIGVILVAVGLKFFHEGFERLRDGEEAHFGTLAIIVTVISILFKEVLAQFSIRKGKELKMYSMVADGWHHRTDAISSVIILLGIFAGGYLWWIDGALGMIVGAMIVWTGYRILNDTIKPLLGENPDDEIVENLEKLSEQIYEDDLDIHHIHVHKYGSHAEITFHIVLPGEMDLNSAHKITKSFVLLIGKELNMTATIYLDAKK